MVVYYSCDESVIWSFFRWKFTLTRELLTGFEFWTIMGLAALFNLLIDFGVLVLPEGLKQLEIGPLIGPIYSMAIFTAVFYNGQCYQRYVALYQGCMSVDMEVKILVAEILSDFSFDPGLRRYALLCTKYLIASAFFLHMGQDPYFAEEDLKRFIEKGLLSKHEVQVVWNFPGDKVMLLHHWTQMVASAAVLEKSVQERFSPPERASMENRIYNHIDRLSDACARIANTLKLPVPFPYFHLLQLLIVLAVLCAGLLSCLLVAKVPNLTFGVALIPVAVISYSLLALRELSVELSDPFGQDAVDFPRYDFMRHIQDHCVAMLNADFVYNPVASALDNVEEFSARQVSMPCDPGAEVTPEMRERLSLFMDVNYRPDSSPAMHTWRTPENYESGLRVKRWMEEELAKATHLFKDSGAEGDRTSRKPSRVSRRGLGSMAGRHSEMLGPENNSVVNNL